MSPGCAHRAVAADPTPLSLTVHWIERRHPPVCERSGTLAHNTVKPHSSLDRKTSPPVCERSGSPHGFPGVWETPSVGLVSDKRAAKGDTRPPVYSPAVSMGSFLVVLALEPSKPLLLGLSVASGSPPGPSLQRLVYSLIMTARVRPPPCSQKVSSYRSPSRAASQQIAARVVGDRQRIAVASILGAKLSFEVNRENLMGNHRSQLQRGLDRPDSTSLSFPLNQSGLLEDLLDRRGRRSLDLRLTLTQPIHQRLKLPPVRVLSPDRRASPTAGGVQCGQMAPILES